MNYKGALKFFTALDSRGHFRFSNKSGSALNANAHFLEKVKYYTYIIMLLQKLVV